MIEAINLTKKYDGQIALTNLNLTVESGEIFCLLGANGAGKTTTINLFLGLTEATSGKALINNQQVRYNQSATNKMVAYIPEVVQLYGNLTAIENLDFFCRLAGYKYTKQELTNWLLKVGLSAGTTSKKLSSFSKGMRQKVAIAIALSKNAEIIFMDEPTSGLDPKAIAEFTDTCKELSINGKSIFMATHDIFNAVGVGTSIGIMKEGILVHASGTSNITAEELQGFYLKTI